MPNPENLIPHRYKPGQTGNPKGYSRGRRAIDHLLELIEQEQLDKAIAQRWLDAILGGDFRYMREYLERRDGKVPQPLQIGTDESKLSDLVGEAEKRAIERKRGVESGQQP